MSATPITDLARAYAAGARLLGHRRNQMMARAAADAELSAGAARGLDAEWHRAIARAEALGVSRGYGLAIGYLKSASGARLALAAKVTACANCGESPENYPEKVGAA